MKINVQITKKVQEYEFEPYSISIGTEAEVNIERKKVNELIKEAYHNLEKIVDELIEERLNKTEEE